MDREPPPLHAGAPGHIPAHGRPAPRREAGGAGPEAGGVYDRPALQVRVFFFVHGPSPSLTPCLLYFRILPNVYLFLLVG